MIEDGFGGPVENSGGMRICVGRLGQPATDRRAKVGLSISAPMGQRTTACSDVTPLDLSNDIEYLIGWNEQKSRRAVDLDGGTPLRCESGLPAKTIFYLVEPRRGSRQECKCFSKLRDK